MACVLHEVGRPASTLASPAVLGTACAAARLWMSSSAWQQWTRHYVAPSDVNGEGGKPEETKRIYVKKIGHSSCTESLMIGLMSYFRRVFPSVGFFKPIGTDLYHDGLPRNVALMHGAFKMHDDPHKMFAIQEDEAFQMLANRGHMELIELCYSRLCQYEAPRPVLKSEEAVAAKETGHDEQQRPRGKDLVVINGWRRGGFAINAELARYMDAPVLLSLDHVPGESPTRGYDRAMAEVMEYRNAKCQVLGVALSRVPQPEFADVHTFMKEHLTAAGVGYLGTVPNLDILRISTLDQIYSILDGKLLFSDLGQVHMGEPIVDVYPVTSHCGTMLDAMHGYKRPLIVTTPDRIDTITTCVAAHSSGVAPLAGIVIADHSGTPSPFRRHLRDIFEGLERADRAAAGESRQFRLPIFTTSRTAFDAIKAIANIDPAVLPTSDAKIKASRHAFDDYMDPDVLTAGFAKLTHKLTPARFLFGIRQKCAADKQRVVLPEAKDHRILMAAAEVQAKGWANVTLLGHEASIRQECAKIGADLQGVTITDPESSPALGRYIDALVDARRKKGLTREGAIDLLKDVNYYGTMMVRCGDADGLVSGAAHSTAATIRPGMQVLKDPDMPLISSIFFMCLPDKVLVYGDCAVNVDPNPEQLALIAIASADTARAFGIEPRVAMLSYSTLGSGSGPQVEKVTEAVRLARAKRPDLELTGPIQYDAATNERIAKVKVKGDESGVPGRATVLIFPDLNTGNNTYKAVQQATGALALGPLMQGLAGAVNDLSRGCTVQDVVDTICATCVQAQFKRTESSRDARE